MEKIKNSVVSYELAEILDGRIDSIFHYSKMDKLLLPVKDINNPLDYYKAPILSDVVNWIFDNLTACDINDALLDYDINQLKFWYTTLLDHNFGLMHEFIGRLEDWFEDNNIELFYYNSNWNIVTTNKRSVRRVQTTPYGL